MSHTHTILIVDDDRTLLVMLDSLLRQQGHNTIMARSGEEALELLKLHATTIDSVLLDRMMPGMDGLAVVRHMKQHDKLRAIPIIMQTGSDTPEQVREGIDAGVFYYLTKPVQDSVLKSVLAAALREREQWRQLDRQRVLQHAGFHLIETCRLHCRSLDEAESLAAFLANSFPDPARSAIGLAELLVNAVEHGNLGIGYDEKGRLLASGNWRSEVNRRVELPEHAAKRVEVLLQRKPEGTFVQITDMGQGFDWKSFLTIDPSRTTDAHGRGIAQANAQSFDSLRYNAQGNQVLAVAYSIRAQTQSLEW